MTTDRYFVPDVVASFAMKAGFSTRPPNSQGETLLATDGGETRFYVRLDSNGWFTVTSADRSRPEVFELAAADRDVLDRYFLMEFGQVIRSMRRVPFVELPDRAQELNTGYSLGDAPQGRRALVSSTGAMLAVARSEILGTATLVELSYLLDLDIAAVAALYEVTDDTATVHVSDPRESAECRESDERLAGEAAGLIEPIVQELAASGPPRWERFEAVFAIAGEAEVAQLRFHDATDTVAAPVPVTLMGLVREHRRIAVWMSAGPWWRMLLSVDNSGRVEEQYDYGERPFPDDQLFRPQDYHADIETLPRARVPVWLAGYIAGPAAQGRPPQVAAAAARADAQQGSRPPAGARYLRSAWRHGPAGRSSPPRPRACARTPALGSAPPRPGSRTAAAAVPRCGWVASPAVDSARSALATLDWLELNGHGHLVPGATVVVSAARPGRMPINMDQLAQHFLAHVRSIFVIPFDSHLAEGSEISLELMDSKTRQTCMELADAVADGFRGRKHPHGRPR
jgi:hypothetical protein